MLTHLHISNFAIIDEVEIDFHTGETVLTGETGAGKSILLDALGLVLGDRADAYAVREGEQQADITAIFNIQNVPEALQWLQAQALHNNDHECILRRVIGNEGRSKAFINGRPTTLQNMKELGEMLVSIHGQHEHQNLLKREMQRKRLDDYANHTNILEELAHHYAAWKTGHEKLTALQLAEKKRGETLDLLRFQVQEFNHLNLQVGEYQSLNDRHKRLAHASRLLTSSQTALTTLYDGDEQTLHNQISHIYSDLQQQLKIDDSLAPAVELLNTALIQIQETADILRDYSEKLEIDPAELENIEERLGIIHDLSRKHRTSPEELYVLAENLKEELHNLEDMDQQLQTLSEREKQLSAVYRDCAARLHKSRQRAAKQLSDHVTSAMQELAMQGGLFIVRVELKPDNAFSAIGLDDIELLVSTNSGQTARALSKIASGGELSRISLAIQMTTASCEPIPTLIFDEVDAGIGGATAEIVGRHLKTLGEHRQVMCVTHLAQVAAQAHHHLKVSKIPEITHHAKGIKARSLLEQLNPKQRVQEIARMLGGLEITENTLKHAEEMLYKTAS